MADPRITKCMAAHTAARAAAADATELFRSTFPPGSSLSWMHPSNNSIQHGVVLAVGYSGRLRVRNQNTNAEYWVSHGDVYRAYE